MTDETYAEPGNCVKCGDESLLYWEVARTRRDLPSHLGAKCRRCGFTWRVIAKDEVAVRFGNKRVTE